MREVKFYIEDIAVNGIMTLIFSEPCKNLIHTINNKTLKIQVEEPNKSNIKFSIIEK